MSCRGRLAALNEKLTRLERKIEYLEARVSIKTNYANLNHTVTSDLFLSGDQRRHVDVTIPIFIFRCVKFCICNFVISNYNNYTFSRKCRVF